MHASPPPSPVVRQRSGGGDAWEGSTTTTSVSRGRELSSGSQLRARPRSVSPPTSPSKLKKKDKVRLGGGRSNSADAAAIPATTSTTTTHSLLRRNEALPSHLIRQQQDLSMGSHHTRRGGRRKGTAALSTSSAVMTTTASTTTTASSFVDPATSMSLSSSSSHHRRNNPTKPSPSFSSNTSKHRRGRKVWQWTVVSISFLFRATSILGAILFCFQYLTLATGINVEMKVLAHVDWNRIDVELNHANTGLSLSQQQQQQQTLQQGNDGTANTRRINNNNNLRTRSGGGVHYQNQNNQQQHPFNETQLPSFVLCADGRNVSSCHLCATTLTTWPGLAGCASEGYCQWCPYGAVEDHDNSNNDDNKLRRQGVIVYDSDGLMTKVYDAHLPLGAQCVSSTHQTCRPAPTSSSLQVWEQDVQQLATKPFMAEMAQKAAPHIVPKQCTSRGFQYCPYGALHSYHEAAAAAAAQQQGGHHVNATASRSPQCIPRRLHCQPPDELLVQPTDRMYQGQVAAVVIPKFQFIFVQTQQDASTDNTWMTLLQRLSGSTNLLYLSDLSRTEATDLWMSPAWTKAIMVRDPKERLVAAYLNTPREQIQKFCCSADDNLQECSDTIMNHQDKNNMTLAQFVELLDTQPSCWTSSTTPWSLQSEHLERKYWSYVTHVLHWHRAAQETQQLLQGLGAWEEYGKSGWGSDGTASIFSDSPGAVREVIASKVASYLNDNASAGLEAKVEKLFAKDYKKKQLGFEQNSVAKMATASQQQKNGGQVET